MPKVAEQPTQNVKIEGEFEFGNQLERKVAITNESD